jgi:hypothetical protein
MVVVLSTKLLLAMLLTWLRIWEVTDMVTSLLDAKGADKEGLKAMTMIAISAQS